jgi:hypothetical protein
MAGQIGSCVQVGLILFFGLFVVDVFIPSRHTSPSVSNGQEHPCRVVILEVKFKIPLLSFHTYSVLCSSGHCCHVHLTNTKLMSASLSDAAVAFVLLSDASARTPLICSLL